MKKPLSPEKQLQLYLAECGFPSQDLPRLLSYCPQLIHSFTLEELAAVGFANRARFVPQKRTLYLRPIVYDICSAEAGRNNISDFIEDAIAIYASDTVETTLTTQLLVMREKLRSG